MNAFFIINGFQVNPRNRQSELQKVAEDCEFEECITQEENEESETIDRNQEG